MRFQRPLPSLETSLRVLVGCEFSGIVREAFRARGYDAVSCDLLPSEREGPHIRADIFAAIDCDWWDMLIVFWPCTHLAVSGARWFKWKKWEQEGAIEGARRLLDCRIPKIALENPVGVLSTHIRKPDQIIQPWQFGHGETKATCLWLKNLPKLMPTNIVAGRRARVHREPPSVMRARNRSRTYQGIAEAMAEQWGAL